MVKLGLFAGERSPLLVLDSVGGGFEGSLQKDFLLADGEWSSFLAPSGPFLGSFAPHPLEPFGEFLVRCRPFKPL